MQGQGAVQVKGLLVRWYLNIFQPESLVDVICCQHPALGVPHELLCLLDRCWLYTDTVCSYTARVSRPTASSGCTWTISRNRYSTSGDKAFAASSLIVPTSRLWAIACMVEGCTKLMSANVGKCCGQANSTHEGGTVDGVSRYQAEPCAILCCLAAAAAGNSTNGATCTATDLCALHSVGRKASCARKFFVLVYLIGLRCFTHTVGNICQSRIKLDFTEHFTPKPLVTTLTKWPALALA